MLFSLIFSYLKKAKHLIGLKCSTSFSQKNFCIYEKKEKEKRIVIVTSMLHSE